MWAEDEWSTHGQPPLLATLGHVERPQAPDHLQPPPPWRRVLRRRARRRPDRTLRGGTRYIVSSPHGERFVVFLERFELAVEFSGYVRLQPPEGRSLGLGFPLFALEEFP